MPTRFGDRHSRLDGLGLSPGVVALCYAVFGLVLLAISDYVFPQLFADEGLLHSLQAAKGAIEVGLSALFIYVLVASSQRALHVKERALDEAPVGITIADARQPDNPLVYANDGFERLTGYPAEESLGRNCRFLQGERTDEETVAAIRAAIADERHISTEILNYRRDGTPFWNRLDVETERPSGTASTSFRSGARPRPRTSSASSRTSASAGRTNSASRCSTASCVTTCGTS